MKKKTFSLIIIFGLFLAGAAMAQTLQPEAGKVEGTEINIGAAAKVKAPEFKLTGAELELFARLVHAGGRR